MGRDRALILRALGANVVSRSLLCSFMDVEALNFEPLQREFFSLERSFQRDLPFFGEGIPEVKGFVDC